MRVLPPLPSDAPAFVESVDGRLQPAAPLGFLQFVVTQRLLPRITQFNVVLGPGLDATACSGAVEDAEALVSQLVGIGSPTVSALCAVRLKLLEDVAAVHGSAVRVAFGGVDSGVVTATVVVAAAAAAGVCVCETGLEGSVQQGGRGMGITPFVRRAQPATPSTPIQATAGSSVGLQIQLGTGAAAEVPSMSATASQHTSRQQQAAQRKGVGRGVEWRPWQSDEMQQAQQAQQAPGDAANGGTAGGVGGFLARFLTRTYSKLQGNAGVKVGIMPGHAWRVALDAAAASGGVQLVLLGDRPARITAERLGAGVWSRSAPLLIGGLLGGLGVAACAVEGLAGMPTPALAALAVLLPMAACWPLAGPLVEVQRFSLLSAGEIEEAVTVRVAAQDVDSPIKLWGEDGEATSACACSPLSYT